MKKFNDPNNNILDKIKNNEFNGKCYGLVEGFSVTTFFSKSKNVMLDKKMIYDAWEKIKTDPKLSYLVDNHNAESPFAGYIKSAYLIENEDFLGIYIKASIINKTAWRKFESGEYTGFSGAFGNKLLMNKQKISKKTIEIIIEKNSYNDDQIKVIKSSFSTDVNVIVNEVMRFSEIPLQIININIFIDIEYLLEIIQYHQIELGSFAIISMILSSSIDVIVKDIYTFIKKSSKTLFSGKLRPKMIIKNSTMNRNILINLEAESNEELEAAVKTLSNTYKELMGGKKSKLETAKKIQFSRKNGKWQLLIED